MLLETDKRLRSTPAKALKDSVLGLTGAATKAKPARVKAVKKKPTDVRQRIKKIDWLQRYGVASRER